MPSRTDMLCQYLRSGTKLCGTQLQHWLSEMRKRRVLLQQQVCEGMELFGAKL